MFLTKAFYKHSNGEHNLITSRHQVATITRPRLNCPTITNLPGASPALLSHVTAILKACQGFKSYPSKRLKRRQFSSLALLELDPPLFLVDGSDQTREAAAKSVDTFLAAHAVLEVAWEPVYPSEPSWWVLVPRPKGMPGVLQTAMFYYNI